MKRMTSLALLKGNCNLGPDSLDLVSYLVCYLLVVLTFISTDYCDVSMYWHNVLKTHIENIFHYTVSEDTS
uniref:Uncharacterized protein n=1 Tax=Anguilla anguilla TaxID=7936 RepID=A0A0E9WNX4_ANGAN